MCITCGCGDAESRIDDGSAGGSRQHASAQPDDHEHSHGHLHGHEHGNADRFRQQLTTAHFHAVAAPVSRSLSIERDILEKNNEYAGYNRRRLLAQHILALNLVSSPGSGKTCLLVRTIQDLRGEMALAVIEGDQQTSNDADRIRATGVSAVQINTGKGCHLDAHMVGHALDRLGPLPNSILFIENVGNLVCPAAFDLGEAHKVVILSVTEGEDKPLKYPDMFQAADIMLLNKVDLLPYLEFDVTACINNARRVNPDIQVLQVSATKGDGLADWYQWLRLHLQPLLAKTQPQATTC